MQSALRNFDGNETTLTSRFTKHETYLQLLSNLRWRLILRNSSAFLRSKKRITMDEIENYTCIAVSRHPVSRFVSLYGYLKTINHASASAYNNINSFFDDWVAGKMKDDLYSLRPQSDFIQGVKRNNLEIVKYENLSDAVIIYTGGGELNILLGRENTSRAQYRSVLTPRNERYVEEIYKVDMELFGY